MVVLNRHHLEAFEMGGEVSIGFCDLSTHASNGKWERVYDCLP